MKGTAKVESFLGEESEVIQPNPQSKSVRTTIPPGIRNMIKLEAGDVLIWEWRVIDGRMTLTVRKK